MCPDSRQKKQVEQYYRKMYSTLYIYANSVLNDASLAEEAVQDTFCIACAKTSEFLGGGNPEGWLMNTLKYVVRNMLRQRAKMGRLVIMSLNDEDAACLTASDEENIDVLYGDIAGQEDFQLFKRVALEGKSMREVSNELGITLEACKKRIQRTRNRLQKIFQKNKK